MTPHVGTTWTLEQAAWDGFGLAYGKVRWPLRDLAPDFSQKLRPRALREAEQQVENRSAV